VLLGSFSTSANFVYNWSGDILLGGVKGGDEISLGSKLYWVKNLIN